MDIDLLIGDVIGCEGGYANHPGDRGGATRWGITEPVARGDMRVFPREEAVAIYERIYWLRPGFDRVGGLAPGSPPSCSTPASTWGRRSWCRFFSAH